MAENDLNEKNLADTAMMLDLEHKITRRIQGEIRTCLFGLVPTTTFPYTATALPDDINEAAALIHNSLRSLIRSEIRDYFEQAEHVKDVAHKLAARELKNHNTY